MCVAWSNWGLETIPGAIVSLHAFLEMSNCQVGCADNGALMVKRSAQIDWSSHPSAAVPAELITVSAGTAVSCCLKSAQSTSFGNMS